MKKIQKFVLAGGPGCGKSTNLELMKAFPISQNVNVIFLEEAATALLHDPPKDMPDSPVLRQFMIFRTQLLLEKTAVDAAKRSKKPTIIVQDRGLLDLYSYLEDAEAKEICITDLKGRYDGVICYQHPGFLRKNNSFRHETLAEALLLSERTIAAWKAHAACPVHLIAPTDTIEEKARETAGLINRLAGMTVFPGVDKQAD